MKKKFVVLLMLALAVLFVAGCGSDTPALESVNVEMHQESRMAGNVTVEVA